MEIALNGAQNWAFHMMRRQKCLTIIVLACVLVFEAYRYVRSCTDRCPNLHSIRDGPIPLPLDEHGVAHPAPTESLASTDSKSAVYNRPLSVIRLRFKDHMLSSGSDGMNYEPSCERWAVIATASVTSEAIRRQSKLVGWCMVMVVDSDKDCLKWRDSRSGNKVVTCLSPKKLKEMDHPFANALPKSQVARKNVGYLYAIQHGAQVVWDFDDRSLMKFWMSGAAPDSSLVLDSAIKSGTIDAAQPDGHLFLTYNPYPALSPSSGLLWPRGLPLSHIGKLEQNSPSLSTLKVDSSSIAVLQSVSDITPDLYAIDHLSRPFPISFKRTMETNPTIIPIGTMSPYNSQASLHFRAGFWAFLLPTTVHSRVSDIWRSYIAQRLFWDVGLHLGFMARPIVTREPDSINIMDDFFAENTLHSKSDSLIDFLQHWQSDANTLVERAEQLWVALYDEGYIEELDVEILQLWLQSLLDIGYKFPGVIPNQKFQQKYYPKNSGTKMESINNGNCKLTTSLTFWTSDLHDGTRIDMTSALSSMGHNVIVAGLKGYRSPYPYVFNMTGVNVYTRLSVPITEHLQRHSTPLDEDTIKVNFEFYKSDSTIAATDAFFCSFPASMCEMWMPFNKTIVYLPAHRYNIGRCTKARWDRLNEHLHVLVSMDEPKHVIAAESVYDLEYLRHYTGIIPLPLFSFSGFYTQLPSNEYLPKHDEILVFNRWEESIRQSTSKFILKEIRSVYPHYTLANLSSHPAIVFFPYSVMSYKFTEVYSLSIPLFVPSMQLMRAKRYVSLDRTSVSRLYCNQSALDGEMVAHPNSPHPYSPNVEAMTDSEAEAYWLQLSDFYVLPHITYFDDYSDLGRKLESADFKAIHLLMLEENEHRKQQLLDNWCQASHRIQRGRKVPQNYQKAISELYRVDQLQAP